MVDMHLDAPFYNVTILLDGDAKTRSYVCQLDLERFLQAREDDWVVLGSCRWLEFREVAEPKIEGSTDARLSIQTRVVKAEQCGDDYGPDLHLRKRNIRTIWTIANQERFRDDFPESIFPGRF